MPAYFGLIQRVRNIIFPVNGDSGKKYTVTVRSIQEDNDVEQYFASDIVLLIRTTNFQNFSVELDYYLCRLLKTGSSLNKCDVCYYDQRDCDRF